MTQPVTIGRVIERMRRAWKYRKTWRTPLGRDCISLDASLCEWLAERLAFLAHHHHSFPGNMTSESWATELLTHAMAFSVYAKRREAETFEEEQKLIKQAQDSLHWIADNLPDMWD